MVIWRSLRADRGAVVLSFGAPTFMSSAVGTLKFGEPSGHVWGSSGLESPSEISPSEKVLCVPASCVRSSWAERYQVLLPISHFSIQFSASSPGKSHTKVAAHSSSEI